MCILLALLKLFCSLSLGYEKVMKGTGRVASIGDSRRSINDLINENEEAKPSQENADALLTGQRQRLAIKIACFI